MTTQLFIPTVAEFADDVMTSWTLQKPLVTARYTPGLMVVLRNGLQGSTNLETVTQQYCNLLSQADDYGSNPLVVMLPNLPIEDIDFLHNPHKALAHVKAGIDFARKSPIGSNNIVTFHLNSLVPEDDFKGRTAYEWHTLFGTHVLPRVAEASRYAEKQGIHLMIETVPAPEFGDLQDTDGREYMGIPLNRLRNPFYISHVWGFKELRGVGLGLALDLSHSRTLYAQARIGDPEGVLHPEDIKYFADATLQADVSILDPRTDLVHLNDGAGVYNRQKGTVHHEGVALGKGEITDLSAITAQIIGTGIPTVLEIHETDFKERPNTKNSIDYILAQNI